ncbi:MAG TPA: hypothetical protein VLC09_16335 [Polyangiaceae bacterium]|nr:hypothetical protein [Polyangiaceae bacterium]
MNDTLEKVQILGRAQAAMLRAQLRRSVQKLVVVAVGLVFALLALGSLNYAALMALQKPLGAPLAGLALGLLDLLVAAVLFAKGLAEPPPSEEEILAKQISEMATNGLSRDLDEAREELREFMRDTKQLGQVFRQVSSFLGEPVVQLLKLLFGWRGPTGS